MVFPNLVKFQVKETEQSITPFAGLALIGRLAKQLKLLNRIDQTLPFKERERGFHPSEVVMSIANVFLAGGTCLNDVHAFDSDAALTKLFGIEKFPDDSTLGAFLRKFTKLSIFRLGHINTALIRRLISEQGLSRLTIDSDSSIFPSHKKDAHWTYLEKIRGYNPLFASIAELHHAIPFAVFREGNAAPQSHALSFSHALWQAFPEGLDLWFRLDSAWFRADVLDFWHEKGAHFAITADLDSSVIKSCKSIPEKDWKRASWDPTVSIAETVHVLSKSKRAYRLIVLRFPKLQPDLFDDRFHYHAIFTNIDDWELEAVVVWRRKRFGDEHLFDEFKNDLGAKHIPCDDFLPNAAFFQILVLAYNLVQYLKFRFLPKNWHSVSIKTFRFNWITVAASVTVHARRICLNLFKDYAHIKLFERLSWRLLAVG